jgi:hypothetical protein
MLEGGATKEWIYAWPSQVEWLEKQSPAELHDWLRSSLETHNTRPIRLGGRDVSDPSRIVDLLRSTCDYLLKNVQDKQRHMNFRKNIEDAIKRLLTNWSESADPTLEYFISLTFLIGSLEITECYDDLMNRLVIREFDYRPDVHLMMLRVALGRTPKSHKDMRIVCERDIKDTRYASLCFRALYELDSSQRLKNIREYLPIMVRHSVEHPEHVDLGMTLLLLYDMLPVGVFVDQITHCYGVLHDRTDEVTLVEALLSLPVLRKSSIAKSSESLDFIRRLAESTVRIAPGMIAGLLNCLTSYGYMFTYADVQQDLNLTKHKSIEILGPLGSVIYQGEELVDQVESHQLEMFQFKKWDGSFTRSGRLAREQAKLEARKN